MRIDGGKFFSFFTLATAEWAGATGVVMFAAGLGSIYWRGTCTGRSGFGPCGQAETGARPLFNTAHTLAGGPRTHWDLFRLGRTVAGLRTFVSLFHMPRAYPNRWGPAEQDGARGGRGKGGNREHSSLGHGHVPLLAETVLFPGWVCQLLLHLANFNLPRTCAYCHENLMIKIHRLGKRYPGTALGTGGQGTVRLRGQHNSHIHRARGVLECWYTWVRKGLPARVTKQKAVIFLLWHAGKTWRKPASRNLGLLQGDDITAGDPGTPGSNILVVFFCVFV